MKELLIGSLLGTVVGAILSFIATEISAVRRNKEDSRLRRDNLTNEIITQSLDFLFLTNEIINGIIVNREVFEIAKQTNPGFAADREKAIYRDFDEKTRNGFFHKLFYHSFQLKRLENQKLWKEFEALIILQKELIDKLLAQNPLTQCEEIHRRYGDLQKQFVNDCMKATRIANEPIVEADPTNYENFNCNKIKKSS